MNEKIYIYAGNLHQYLAYVKDRQMEKVAVFLSFPGKIMGADNPTVIKIGTWWERADVHEVERVLESCKATVLSDHI